MDGLRVAIISGILIGLFRALNSPRVFRGLPAIPLQKRAVQVQIVKDVKERKTYEARKGNN